METVFYRCDTCGFTHQVPSYWSGYDPDEELDMPHINLATKEMCSDMVLKLVESKV